jgi:hypothetical protein
MRGYVRRTGLVSESGRAARSVTLPSKPVPALPPGSEPEAGPIYRAPWDDPDPTASRDATPIDGRTAPSSEPIMRRRGRRPGLARAAGDAAPPWLYHHLTVSVPRAGVDAFAAAARGGGVIPWRFDLDRFEEDVFLRAATVPAAERGLSIEGCHRLARQFRSLVEVHLAGAAAGVGYRRECPFDLHVLLPVPDAILALGATHPAALAWLASHWGVTDRLRQVTVRSGATARHRLPRGHDVIGYGFFTPGETPHRAIATLAARFPALQFTLRPVPAD